MSADRRVPGPHDTFQNLSCPRTGAIAGGQPIAVGGICGRPDSLQASAPCPTG
ncbi:MAG: hypothetical protein KatS3mg110_1462 [Pirellulaceae bacterium]|nr:MAG: hypothetical protein KatS3mg110_1462 [Pirellulaceae bacterium]